MAPQIQQHKDKDSILSANPITTKCGSSAEMSEIVDDWIAVPGGPIYPFNGRYNHRRLDRTSPSEEDGRDKSAGAIPGGISSAPIPFSISL